MRGHKCPETEHLRQRGYAAWRKIYVDEFSRKGTAVDLDVKDNSNPNRVLILPKEGYIYEGGSRTRSISNYNSYSDQIDPLKLIPNRMKNGTWQIKVHRTWLNADGLISRDSWPSDWGLKDTAVRRKLKKITIVREKTLSHWKTLLIIPMNDGNRTDRIMKKSIVLFYVLAQCIYASAQRRVDIKDGAFLNSIDWFIKSTVDYWTNLSTPKKITSFNQLGIVRVEFYNMPDSVELRKNLKEDSSGNTTEIIEHRRCQYFVTARSRAAAIALPPSFYFIRNGIIVVIYTGIERLVQYKKADMEFRKVLGSDKMEVQLNATSEYFIRIDPKYPNGYVAIEKKGQMTN